MNIPPVSSSLPPAVQAAHAARAAPLKHGREADHNLNTVETKQAEGSEPSKGGALNIKA